MEIAVAQQNCSENFLEDPSPAPRRRPGASKGNRNACKHGLRTREMDEFRALVRAHLRETRVLLKEVRMLCVRSYPP